jgi:integrase
LDAVRGAHTLVATLFDADYMPRYTVHQVRHTCGTEMIAQRYPLHVVQKTLGHLDPRSTP